MKRFEFQQSYDEVLRTMTKCVFDPQMIRA